MTSLIEKLTLFAVAAVAILPVPRAQAAAYVGSPPPPWNVEWIEGQGVDVFDQNTVYIIGFWRETCNRSYMTHVPKLNKIHHQYANRVPQVRVVGVQTDAYLREGINTVKRFLDEGRSKNRQFDYPVGHSQDAWREWSQHLTCIVYNHEIKLVCEAGALNDITLNEIAKNRWQYGYQPAKVFPDCPPEITGAVPNEQQWLHVFLKHTAFENKLAGFVDRKDFAGAIGYLAQNKAVMDGESPGIHTLYLAHLENKKGNREAIVPLLREAALLGKNSIDVQFGVARWLYHNPQYGERALALGCAQRYLELSKPADQGAAKLLLLRLKYHDTPAAALKELPAIARAHPAVGQEIEEMTLVLSQINQWPTLPVWDFLTAEGRRRCLSKTSLVLWGKPGCMWGDTSAPVPPPEPVSRRSSKKKTPSRS